MVWVHLLRYTIPVLFYSYYLSGSRLKGKIYKFENMWNWSTSQENKGTSMYCKQWEKEMVGLPGIEPGTSRLSGVRSNRLSYKPTRSVLKRRDVREDTVMLSLPKSTINYTPQKRICQINLLKLGKEKLENREIRLRAKR